MKTRIITAIVLLIVILPCVIWGGLPFKALIGIVAGIAVFEMLSICNRPKAHIYLYPIVAIFVFYSLYFEKSTAFMASCTSSKDGACSSHKTWEFSM